MSKSLNLSPVSYAQWLKLVFDHPVSPSNEDEVPDVISEWFWQEGVDFHVSNPTRLVAHFARMCREFTGVSDVYTLEQINSGIWFLLSAKTEFGKCLADAEIPIDERLDCVRAMFHVYADFVAPSPVEKMENGFYMWWDLLCDTSWGEIRWRIKGDEIMAQMDAEEEARIVSLSPEARAWNARFEAIRDALQPGEDLNDVLHAHGMSFDDFPSEEIERKSTKIDITWNDLSVDEQRVMDAMLQTLVEILYLDDIRCEAYALHGLNHLNHPARVAAVQKFIDERCDEWDEETLSWAEGCRDGKMM